MPSLNSSRKKKDFADEAAMGVTCSVQREKREGGGRHIWGGEVESGIIIREEVVQEQRAASGSIEQGRRRAPIV